MSDSASFLPLASSSVLLVLPFLAACISRSSSVETVDSAFAAAAASTSIDASVASVAPPLLAEEGSEPPELAMSTTVLASTLGAAVAARAASSATALAVRATLASASKTMNCLTLAAASACSFSNSLALASCCCSSLFRWASHESSVCGGGSGARLMQCPDHGSSGTP